MMNPSRKITTVLTFFTLLLFSYQSHASPSPPVTALFVFGDSTVDPGNNNYIPTIFRGNHSPYGIDFPGKLSTGRFSNGKLTTDFLASFLGLKPTLPAYLDPTVQPGDLLTGVSFASAGTGLDDRTARLSSALTMDKELTYFDEAVGKMKKAVGDGETNRVISNALFVISVGTNDMTINLYDQPFGGFKSVSNYQDSLLNKLEGVIKRLYQKGAKRFIVSGLPPIGCVPIQITIESLKQYPRMFKRACSDEQNNDSRFYNSKLQRLALRLNQSLSGSKILYLDIYSPILDMITYPEKYGLEETKRGCCGTGKVEAGPLCDTWSPTCEDPSKFLFFDSIHPSQTAYSSIAKNVSVSLFPLL